MTGAGGQRRVLVADDVLLDLMMPRLGVDALKRIRKLDPGITVLVLTGTDDARLRQEAIALGAAAIVSKPVAPGDLLPLLGPHGADAGATTPRDHDETRDAPSVIGTGGARVLIVDDDAEVSTTMRDFLQSR